MKLWPKIFAGLLGLLAASAATAATTVAVTAPVAGATLSVNSPTLLSANVTTDPGVNATGVEFLVNGVVVGTDTTFPYSFSWTPTSAPGTYFITARVTDTASVVTTSAAVTVTLVDPTSGSPTISITSPANGATIPVGVSRTLTVSAAPSAGATIASVQYFANGVSLGAVVTSSPFNFSWTPTVAGSFALTARVIDTAGKQTTSSVVNITVGSNGAPSVAITTPGSSSTVGAGTPVILTASASDADGTITSVRFLANNVSVGTVSAAPFRVTWTPTASGTYTVVAEATDNSSNVGTSAAITVTVTGNSAPVVSITTPTTGTTIQVGAGAPATTVTASASDPDGTIRSVDFFANGISIGTRSAPPYTVTWTPTAEGIYQLTAVATDNSFASTTSAIVPVIAVTTGGASSVSVFTGIYVGGSESGKFSAVAVGGKFLTFIGHSVVGVPKNYFYPGLPLDTSGGFSKLSNGANVISGSVVNGAVSGTLGANGIFSGSSPSTSGLTPFPQTGYLTGSLTGRPTSSLSAIVGADGSIMLSMNDGALSDVGDTKVDSTGNFTLITASGNMLVGKVEPSTGFLTGTLTVIGNGAFSAPAVGALSTGGSFSDGVLHGLSTRSFVGTGSSIMIAGFIVDGTVPKQIIIRGIGPSLGISGSLANPTLQLFSGSTQIATNDDWGTPISGGASPAAIISATAQAGLTGLNSASLDSVILVTLAPGAYTAQLSGVGSTTGNGLIEIYDLDTVGAFTSQKVRAISTRGFAGAPGSELIAGFIINGSSPKKVLIQAVGPAVAGSVSGTLADPVLKLVNMSTGKVVRENDNWETGNDAMLMVDAVNRSGATPLAAGSKDAGILISLPPGVYTAIASGSGGTTGNALMQVYEVP